MARFWGKLHRLPDSSAVEELALVDHCIDVAQVFRALCDLPGIRRQLAAALPTDESAEVCLDRLAVIALLHDLGKCNVGFQAKRNPEARNTAGHVREVAPLFFDEALCAMAVESLGLQDLAAWFGEPDGLSRFLLAAVSHHGKPAFDWNVADGVDLRSMVRHWQPTDVLDPVSPAHAGIDLKRSTSAA